METILDLLFAFGGLSSLPFIFYDHNADPANIRQRKLVHELMHRPQAEALSIRQCPL